MRQQQRDGAAGDAYQTVTGAERRPRHRTPIEDLERQQQRSLINAIGRCPAILFGRSCSDAALFEALGLIARSGGFHRATLIEIGSNDAQPPVTSTLSWTPDAVVAELNARGANVDPDKFAGMIATLQSEDSALEVQDAATLDTFALLPRTSAARYALCCPIRVGEQLWGALVLEDCSTRRRRSDEEKETVTAAASMFGLARLRVHASPATASTQQEPSGRVEASQAEARPGARALADGGACCVRGADASTTSGELASAYECGTAEHIDEFARANETLRRTLGHLAKQSDLKDFLHSVVQEISAQLRADGCHLVLYDEATDLLTTIAGIQTGKPHSFTFANRIQASTAACFSALRQTHGPRYFDLDAEPEKFWPGTLDYHRAFGTRTIVATPLRLGDRLLGFLAMAFRRDFTLSDPELELVQALCQHATLAAELIRMGDKQREAALSREREAAARARAAELAAAGAALQRTIDATAKMESLDALLPEALSIVSDALGVAAAGYFEHSAGTICCRFWMVRGQKLGPLDLPGLDSTAAQTARRLADGFTVSFQHLGADYLRRTDPNIVDHKTATASPELHAFCRQRGWDWELNVPLTVEGKAEGAYVLFRPQARPFSTSDVSLAAALGKHIALAMQASRVAEREREAAVAREQAAELARANAVLSKSVNDVGSGEHTERFITRMLIEIANITGAQCSALMLVEPAGRLRMHVLTLNGQTVSADCADAHPMLGEWPLLKDIPAMNPANNGLLAMDDFDKLLPMLWAPTVAWHRAQGHVALTMVPLYRDSEVAGMIGLGFDRKAAFTETTSELVRALASQISLVVALDRAATKAREAEVAREREQSARAHAAELARANAALSRSTAQLASHDDLDSFLEIVLQEALVAAGGVSGAVFLLDADGEALDAAVLIVRQQVIDIALDSRAAAYRDPQPTANNIPWQAMAKHRRPWLSDYRHPDSCDWPQSAAWHRALGHRFVLCVPMVHADKAIGFIGICFDEAMDTPPGENKHQVVAALAQHATLAVRLTQLGEQSRKAAIDVERGRVAGEIHDGLAQGFTGILMQSRAALMFEADEGSVRPFLERIKALAADGLAEARRSVFALRSITLEADGLVAAVSRLVDNSAIAGQVDCRLRVQGLFTNLTPAVEDSAYRIIQESIQNALKHASAATITVRLDDGTFGVCVTVEDDGAGLPADIAVRADGSGGLRTMRDRAAACGGEFEATRLRPRGTRIRVRYPANQLFGP